LKMLKVAPLLVILAGFCMQLIFVCTTMTSLVCPCARHIHDILTQDKFMFFSAAWIGNYKNLPFTASQHSAGYLPVVPSLVCWYLGSLSTDSYDTWSWLQVRISLACTLCLSDSQEIGYYEWASKSYEMVVCGYHIIIYETIHMEFSFCALVLLQPISLTFIDCCVLWGFYGHCCCQACVCCAGCRTAFLLFIE
jgi:hypothetical protein